MTVGRENSSTYLVIKKKIIEVFWGVLQSGIRVVGYNTRQFIGPEPSKVYVWKKIICVWLSDKMLDAFP